MLLFGLTALASAAVVTEIPPFLRGDVEIGYAYDQLGGSLTERDSVDVDVADRVVSDHMLRYALTFGVAPGAAVFVELPHYAYSSVSYGSLSDMVYDPGTGSGTYQGTTPGTAGTYVSGGGLGGVWFGARGTPFSEGFAKRNSKVTWLLEGAIRTADPSNFYVVTEDARGAGPAGMAVRLNTTFSTTSGGSRPYVGFRYLGEGPKEVSVTNADGTAGSTIEVDPANEAGFRIGSEFLAAENKAAGSQMVFDLHLDVDYASHAYVPSGIYLPNVLGASKGGRVLQSEALEAGAGIGMHWRAFTNFQLGIYADLAYHVPQRIEYPYPVYTGGNTLHVTAGTNLTVRIR